MPKIIITLFVISTCFFSSSVFSADVSTLLEEGIYAEETKGDLDEAIRIYQKIIDDNQSNITSIAKAYYRLGTCYLKTGDEAKAIEFYKKLMNSFPGQIEVVNDAKNQLSKLGVLDDGNKPLELGPVPWETGETCQYDIKTPAGAGAGKMFHSIKELRKDGNNLWRIENYYSSPIAGSQIYLRTDVLKEGLSPVSSIMRGSATGMGFVYMAKYEKDHIWFTNNVKEKKDIPFEGIVYDITQAYEIIRRLPLTENYSTSYNAFNSQSGKIMNGHLTVTGKETVTVPAGTFECYYIEADFDSTLKSKMWISIDDKKNIVKLEKQGNTTELEKVTHETDGEPVEFNDNEFGISMTAPKGWHLVSSSMLTPTPFKMYLDILSPEIKAALNFVVVENPGPLPSDLEVLKQMFKNFTLRPESWVYGDIDGLPSLTYIADYDSEAKKMVEYRTYVLDNQGMLVSFCLRVEKETFDEIKTDIDSIVQSFKWNKKTKGNEFKDEKEGISMTAPEGWHFINSSISTPFKILVYIQSPVFEAESGFVVVQHFGPLPTMQDEAMGVLKQTYKNFTPRPETWVYGETDGLPSLTYIADYDKEDKKMVEYRTYILNKQELVSFCHRLEKEAFDKVKPGFDSIVQSFKWNKK